MGEGNEKTRQKRGDRGEIKERGNIFANL